jgi:hypothetical protein
MEGRTGAFLARSSARRRRSGGRGKRDTTIASGALFTVRLGTARWVRDVWVAQLFSGNMAGGFLFLLPLRQTDSTLEYGDRAIGNAAFPLRTLLAMEGRLGAAPHEPLFLCLFYRTGGDSKVSSRSSDGHTWTSLRASGDATWPRRRRERCILRRRVRLACPARGRGRVVSAVRCERRNRPLSRSGSVAPGRFGSSPTPAGCGWILWSTAGQLEPGLCHHHSADQVGSPRATGRLPRP